jgi:hypothetical protein
MDWSNEILLLFHLMLSVVEIQTGYFLNLNSPKYVHVANPLQPHTEIIYFLSLYYRSSPANTHIQTVK